MIALARRGAMGALVAGVFVSTAAGACRDDDAVARLTEREGDVDGQKGADASWAPAAVGTEFAIGGAVRTGAGGRARIELEGGALRLGEHSRVRFGAEDRRVGLEIGAAEVETGEDEGVTIHSELGEAEIEPSAHVAVEVDEEGDLRFEVRVGSATVERRGGEPAELEAGEALSVDSRADGGAGTEAEDRAGGEDAAGPAEEADAGPGDAGVEGAVRADVRGEDARIRTGEGAWEPLAAGDTRVPGGAELHVGDGSAVDLARGSGRARIDGEARVRIGTEDGPLARAERGTARVQADGDRVALEVPGGTIVLRGDRGPARGEVAVDAGGAAAVEGGAGRVDVTGEDERAELGAGERAELTADGRVREPERAGDPDPERPADLFLRPGESATVHAPSPPIAARVRVPGACAEGGLIEVATDASFADIRARSRGARAGVVTMERGANYYRAGCEGGGSTRVRGAVRVRRNTGEAPLPERPPHSRVEADGRRYTVHYQNLLPALTFAWPDAPSGDLRLQIRGEDGTTRSARAPEGERRLSSGALDEGRYTFWFDDPAESETRSPETPLAIAFDNAADSAHVREPAVGSSWDPSGVRVRGIALEGWRVSVGGRRLETDADGRFSGMAALRSDARALAIRFAHPERGVHYYLRRPGGG